MKKIALLAFYLFLYEVLFAGNDGLGIPKLSNHGFSNEVIEKKIVEVQDIVLLETEKSDKNSSFQKKEKESVSPKNIVLLETEKSDKNSSFQKKEKESVSPKKNPLCETKKKSVFTVSPKKIKNIQKKEMKQSDFLDTYLKIILILTLVLFLGSLIGLGIYYWIVLSWI